MHRQMDLLRKDHFSNLQHMGNPKISVPSHQLTQFLPPSNDIASAASASREEDAGAREGSDGSLRWLTSATVTLQPHPVLAVRTRPQRMLKGRVMPTTSTRAVCDWSAADARAQLEHLTRR
jgi:hypothetical protein